MEFSRIFREERYYCNHLFRLLCHDKEAGGLESGLGAILATLELLNGSTGEDIAQSQIYTEIAAFRDVFAAKKGKEKDEFLEHLYLRFLPIISQQYGGRITDPIHPSAFKSSEKYVHPRQYANVVHDLSKDKQDLLFYREFSALFSAKPDFLIIFRDQMIWFEAKFWEPFDSRQLQRTRNIAMLCSSDLFRGYFQCRNHVIILLGSENRHTTSRGLENTRFLSWEKCFEISCKLLPNGPENYTSKSLSQMLAMKHSSEPIDEQIQSE